MAAASESSLVVVTGASGFIATHIIKQLQEAGYRVRGTVRSLQDEAKVKHLQDLCPEAQHKLELVEADLTKPETWEPVMKDAEYVIHVASPFPSQAPKEESELIQPAVEGTQSVFKACVTAKSVKRIVLTSSCAAIAWGAAPTADKVFTEEDWSDVEKIDAYAKSKTLAEKTAWDFIKELPDEDKIELAVVNPSYVMGPVLHGSQCTSMEVVKRLMERTMPAVPKISFPVVDVRDVAQAHIKAMTLPDAAGHRHLVVCENMWMKEMAQVLAKEFRPQGYNVPTMNCPYFAMWVTSLFDKTIKLILPEVGKVRKFDNTRMKDVLGVTPHETKDTIIDMAYSLIDGGFIKRSKKFKGRGWQEAEAEAKAKEEEEKKKKEEEEKRKKEEAKEKKEEAKPADGEVAAEKPAENGEVKEEKAEGEEKKEEETKEEEKKEEEKKEEAEAPAEKPAESENAEEKKEGEAKAEEGKAEEAKEEK